MRWEQEGGSLRPCVQGVVSLGPPLSWLAGGAVPGAFCSRGVGSRGAGSVRNSEPEPRTHLASGGW